MAMSIVMLSDVQAGDGDFIENRIIRKGVSPWLPSLICPSSDWTRT